MRFFTDAHTSHLRSKKNKPSGVSTVEPPSSGDQGGSDHEDKGKLTVFKLCRIASSADPPLKDRQWETLATDIETLRCSCFPWVDRVYSLTQYLQALLLACSFDLAYETIQLSVVPLDVVSVMVLKAAQEYFNSSPDSQHRSVDLARMCLSLAPIVTPEVADERALIEACQLLHDFDFPLLPLQLRMETDKLALVMCLETSMLSNNQI